jgi:hypothetical protein
MKVTDWRTRGGERCWRPLPRHPERGLASSKNRRTSTAPVRRRRSGLQVNFCLLALRFSTGKALRFSTGIHKPSKTKVEKGDIEAVVGEFRGFLERAVDGDGKSQSTILEIK